MPEEQSQAQALSSQGAKGARPGTALRSRSRQKLQKGRDLQQGPQPQKGPHPRPWGLPAKEEGKRHQGWGGGRAALDRAVSMRRPFPSSKQPLPEEVPMATKCESVSMRVSGLAGSAS